MSKVHTFIHAVSLAYPHAVVLHNDGGKSPKVFQGGWEYSLTETMIRDGRVITDKDLIPANSKNKIPKGESTFPSVLEGNVYRVSHLLGDVHDKTLIFIRYDATNKVFKVAVADLNNLPLPENAVVEKKSKKSPWSK